MGVVEFEASDEGIWLIMLVVSVVAVLGCARVGADFKAGGVWRIFIYLFIQVWRILIAVGSGWGSRGIATGGSRVGPAGG